MKRRPEWKITQEFWSIPATFCAFSRALWWDPDGFWWVPHDAHRLFVITTRFTRVYKVALLGHVRFASLKILGRGITQTLHQSHLNVSFSMMTIFFLFHFTLYKTNRSGICQYNDPKKHHARLKISELNSYMNRQLSHNANHQLSQPITILIIFLDRKFSKSNVFSHRNRGLHQIWDRFWGNESCRHPL